MWAVHYCLPHAEWPAEDLTKLTILIIKNQIRKCKITPKKFTTRRRKNWTFFVRTVIFDKTTV